MRMNANLLLSRTHMQPSLPLYRPCCPSVIARTSLYPSMHVDCAKSHPRPPRPMSFASSLAPPQLSGNGRSRTSPCL